MRLNPRDLEAFDALMTVGTMTAAAELLRTSQPAISRSIAELERVTGIKLFARSGRLVPTPEAYALHSEVEKSFHGLGRIWQAAVAIRHARRGHVAVVAPPALAYGFLAGACARFFADYPNVMVGIEVQPSTVAAEWIAAQRFDIGLATYDYPLPGGVEAAVFAEPREVCVMPPGHRLCGLDTVTPEDLDGERLIALAPADPYRRRLDHLLADRGTAPSIIAESPHSVTLCEMVSRGLGVAIVNPYTAADFEGRVAVRRFAADLPYVVRLLQPSMRPQSRLAGLFVDVLARSSTEISSRWS